MPKITSIPDLIRRQLLEQETSIEYISPNRDTIVVSGKIRRAENGENYDCLYIGRSPITVMVNNTFTKYKQQVYCCWIISNSFLTPEAALTAAINTANAELDSRYLDRYSDITGYLWTDQNFKVGGHDMEALLRQHIKQYAFLVISSKPIDLSSFVE